MFEITRRTALLGTAAALAPTAWAQDESDVFTGPAGTAVRFASVQAGRAVLRAEDEWMRATSEWQRRAVMQSAQPVTLDEFVRWNNDAVRPWPAEQRQRWRKALAVVMPIFAALKVPLPPEVLLVASNGQESAEAPYTRANAVVLPGPAKMDGYSDELLLAHELWHVAARHAPALATKLYAEIGFEPMPELIFPAAWAPVRIANPDAPNNRHAMALQLAGRSVRLTPVLVAGRTTLKPGETFFHVLDVRLLEVEPDASGSASRAVLGPDGPRWHQVGSVPEYLDRLGANTGYVIHPEETMADNVALLALYEHGASRALRPPPRNVALLQRIRAVLAA